MGVKDSDTHTQSLGKKYRVGDLNLASVAGKEGVEEDAQWWHCEVKEKIDTQSRKDPSAPPEIDGERSALSAWDAEQRSRVFRRESTEAEERMH